MHDMTESPVARVWLGMDASLGAFDGHERAAADDRQSCSSAQYCSCRSAIDSQETLRQKLCLLAGVCIEKGGAAGEHALILNPAQHALRKSCWSMAERQTRLCSGTGSPEAAPIEQHFPALLADAFLAVSLWRRYFRHHVSGAQAA